MSTAIGTFLAQADYLISADDDELAQAAREEMVRAAIERYNRDAPDTQTDDVTGDGGKYYGMAASLSSWEEGFSRIVKIEYPAADISADETPTYLEPEDWQEDYWKAVSGTQTRYLYLPNHSPAATETMRITYTVPYEWSGTPPAVDTPGQDFYAICDLAASFCCHAIATRYSRTSDSTIAADAINHTSRAAEFAARARELWARYKGHMGLDAEIPVRAVGDFVDWDTAPGWPGSREFLFHGKGLR